jgi:antitoxin (DNA-binding transcriptional repressor) of toxin-antitoxin stability system
MAENKDSVWTRGSPGVYWAKLAKEGAVRTVNVHEAKTTLSRLLAEVEAGTDIVIARAGRPVARLCAFRAEGPRELGGLAGRGRVPDDFDSMGHGEIEALFGGRE